jgi:DNA polymerase/3'-5' exonuclease PolX
MKKGTATNDEIADTLDHVADLLEVEHKNTFRVRSYRNAAATGRFGLEDQLESEVQPGTLFTEVPGIGPELAKRIHERLGISTLEELETAAHDGRLERIEGIGVERAEGVHIALAGMLSRSSRRQLRQATEPNASSTEDRPSADSLLAIDDEYRTRPEHARLCSKPGEMVGTSRRCTRTPPWLMKQAGRTTGS